MRAALRVGTLLAAVVGGAMSGPAAQTGGLRLHLPADVRPEMATFVFEAGHGVDLTTRMQPGVYDYVLPVAGADRVKLLLLVPGHATVARELRGAELTGTFEPSLSRLPAVRMNGRLVDSRSRPIPNQALDLQYELIEAMPYFGYIDGPVPTVVMQRTRTDATGAFAFEVPALWADPFFAKFMKPDNEGFRLNSGGGAHSSWDDTLAPGTFAPQAAYPEPFVVIKSERGTLAGRLGPAFLSAHGLDEDLSSYAFDLSASPPVHLQLDARLSGNPRRQRWYNANLKVDGSFHVELPPGRYDVVLTSFGPGSAPMRTIDVAPDIPIVEGQRQVVDRP